ncbi:General odorant-binding protein 71, partial [Pseudolycoriella hygida]
MSRMEKWGIFVLVLMVTVWKCHTLRCQVEDGPSEEELKRVVRTCMRKLGDSSDRNNSDTSDEDSNSDESYDNRKNNDNGKSDNNNNNRGHRFARDLVRYQQQGYDNAYGNRNPQRYDNSYGNNGNTGFDYGNDFGNSGYPENFENNRNYNMSNRNNNEGDSNDGGKSCMMQCFFQEMKMTNSEGFPDKHKVKRIVTQDIRDREMKNFLIDSVQECFHIVEMERRREKCIFSKNIVSCLAERAKANCDDYYNETMIFRKR